MPFIRILVWKWVIIWLRFFQFAFRFSYAKFFTQAFDWLLHTVTVPTALHDIMWWFVASFSIPLPPEDDYPEGEWNDEFVSFFFFRVSSIILSLKKKKSYKDNLHPFPKFWIFVQNNYYEESGHIFWIFFSIGNIFLNTYL